MIIGHLPIAYLATKAFDKWVHFVTPRLFTGLMIGAVLPDVDMLWFLIEGGHTHHHDFITHRPIVWALIFAVGFLLMWPLLAGLGIGGLFHMGLDSIAGNIAWTWPLSDAVAPLVVVPATYDHWVLSFLTHWTFGVEIAATCVALIVWLWTRKNPT